MATVPAFSPLAERIIRLAGYQLGAGDRAIGGQYADEYHEILRALQYIGNRKVDDYGDFRLQDIRSWDREMWGAYWDLQRKFGRLENQLAGQPHDWKDVRPDDDTVTLFVCQRCRHRHDDETTPKVCAPSVDAIMETCSDLAVYAIRTIQILKRLEEKEMVL